MDSGLGRGQRKLGVWGMLWVRPWKVLVRRLPGPLVALELWTSHLCVSVSLILQGVFDLALHPQGELLQGSFLLDRSPCLISFSQPPPLTPSRRSCREREGRRNMPLPRTRQHPYLLLPLLVHFPPPAVPRLDPGPKASLGPQWGRQAPVTCTILIWLPFTTMPDPSPLLSPPWVPLPPSCPESSCTPPLDLLPQSLLQAQFSPPLAACSQPVVGCHLVLALCP